MREVVVALAVIALFIAGIAGYLKIPEGTAGRVFALLISLGLAIEVLRLGINYWQDQQTSNKRASERKEDKKFQDRTTQTGDRILSGVGEIKEGMGSSQAFFAEQRKRELAAKIMHLANQFVSELQSIRAVHYTTDSKEREKLDRLSAELDSAILEATVYFPELRELKIKLDSATDEVFRARAFINRVHSKGFSHMLHPEATGQAKEVRPIAFSSETQGDEMSLRIMKLERDIREALSPCLDSR